jgi:hypothetical protein
MKKINNNKKIKKINKKIKKRKNKNINLLLYVNNIRLKKYQPNQQKIRKVV